MRKLLFLSALLIAACPVFIGGTANAQITFQKTFGGDSADVGYSVQQTTDGGYVITGRTESYGVGDQDIYLLKTNAYGDLQWTKTFGDADSSDRAYSINQTTDRKSVV